MLGVPHFSNWSLYMNLKLNAFIIAIKTSRPAQKNTAVNVFYICKLQLVLKKIYMYFIQDITEPMCWWSWFWHPTHIFMNETLHERWRRSWLLEKFPRTDFNRHCWRVPGKQGLMYFFLFSSIMFISKLYEKCRWTLIRCLFLKILMRSLIMALKRSINPHIKNTGRIAY
jgi:hypothetical protein